MTLTIESPTKEERRARRRFLPLRSIKDRQTNDPDHFSNAEMIAILERHERAIIEAAKKAGLPIGDEYERK